MSTAIPTFCVSINLFLTVLIIVILKLIDGHLREAFQELEKRL